MKTALLFTFLTAAPAIFGSDQYKAEGAGTFPEAASSLRSALRAEGVRVVDGAGKIYCEIWFRASTPGDAKATEQNITLPELPHGALIGVIRYPAETSDRRGQAIKPGVYTLRYSQFPITGDHQGIAPQRDFLILGPVATDKDPNATPDFKTLMEWARVAAGTTHPMSLSVWKSDTFQPGLALEGDRDWVLQVKIGNLPLALIVAGRGES